MNRRETTLLLLALAVAPAARAQPAKASRVAILSGTTPELGGYTLEAVRQRLRELGHIEGRNLVLDVRWAMGDMKRLPALAREIVARRPDAIITGISLGAIALRTVTSTIPIVMAGGDVAAAGLVKNLARPEGNITGISSLQVETSAKLLELALAIDPAGAPIFVLMNPASPTHGAAIGELQRAATTVGRILAPAGAQTPAQIEEAFAQMMGERAKTIIVLPDTIYISNRWRIAELAAKNRIATVFARREHVDTGGLLSYGSSLVEQYRFAAGYVDRILKGAKPSDLPVQQPTKLELVVNLKTATAIGVTIPQSVLGRADVTIQ